jgi:hypothetical protein
MKWVDTSATKQDPERIISDIICPPHPVIQCISKSYNLSAETEWPKRKVNWIQNVKQHPWSIQDSNPICTLVPKFPTKAH